MSRRFVLVYTYVTILQLICGLGSKVCTLAARFPHSQSVGTMIISSVLGAQLDDMVLVYWFCAVGYCVIMAVVMVMGVYAIYQVHAPLVAPCIWYASDQV